MRAEPVTHTHDLNKDDLENSDFDVDETNMDIVEDCKFKTDNAMDIKYQYIFLNFVKTLHIKHEVIDIISWC